MLYQDKFLTVVEVARLLHLTRRSVERYIASGYIRAVNAGPRRRLISRAELERFLGTTF